MEEIVHDEKAEEEEEEAEEGRKEKQELEEKKERGGRGGGAKKRNGVNMDMKNIYRIGSRPTDGLQKTGWGNWE